MSAVLQPLEARLEAMTPAWLNAVHTVELNAYSHPWTRGNFADSLAVGYHCRMLVAPWPGARAPLPATPTGEVLLGYYVAMKGVGEVHLLNITVAQGFQRQGWAPLMLAALAGWSRAEGAQWLWLEVRASNARALAIYARHGFRRVGLRRGYYPAPRGQREDAIVMSLRLDEPVSAWGGLR